MHKAFLVFLSLNKPLLIDTVYQYVNMYGLMELCIMNCSTAITLHLSLTGKAGVSEKSLQLAFPLDTQQADA